MDDALPTLNRIRLLAIIAAVTPINSKTAAFLVTLLLQLIRPPPLRTDLLSAARPMMSPLKESNSCIYSVAAPVEAVNVRDRPAVRVSGAVISSFPF